jgi:hypothetical protein
LRNHRSIIIYLPTTTSSSSNQITICYLFGHQALPSHTPQAILIYTFNFSQYLQGIITMAEQRKATIKNCDMSEAMQQDAVDIASVALSKYNIEKVSGYGDGFVVVVQW